MGQEKIGAEAHAYYDPAQAISRRVLAGRLRRAIQVIWVGLAVLIISIHVIRLPANYAQLSMVCEGAQCESPSLSLKNVADLQAAGLSVDFYATYFITISLTSTLVWMAAAIVIFKRRSDDPMAIFAALTLLLGVNGFGASQSSGLMFFVMKVLMSMSSVCILLFLFVFPDGRFTPRWIVWPVLIILLIETSVDLSLYLFGEPPQSLVLAQGLSVPVAVILWISVQVYRYRSRSGPVQKQQMKWVLFGMAVPISYLAIVTIIFAFMPQIDPQQNTLLNIVGSTLFYLFTLFIPVSIGFAILRYRLWDINLVISQTLVYGTLTIAIIGIYVVAVMGLSTLLGTENNTILSLIVTGIVAISFQPARERLQRVVNQLIFGDRDSPGDALARLGHRMEGTLSPDDVLPTIVTTIRDSLRIPYAGIVLKREGQDTLVAESGKPSDALVAYPMVYQGEQIGELKVAPRTRGEAFNRADRNLLETLAQQAGLAVHGVLLTSALRHSREQLVLAQEEERRRLQRDLHDGLGPVLASLSQRLDVASVLVKRDQDAAVTLLSELKVQVKAVLSEIRQLVYALRPPVLDELGLLSAIREAAIQNSGLNTLTVSLESPEILPHLPAAVEVVAYRVVMEALTNVQRHARAHFCEIRLTIIDNSALEIEIVDDGCGLPDGYNPGVGLKSIRERTAELGGAYRIELRAGGGTRLWVRLPILEG
jgi:signal transduction histidine kinase